MVWIWDFFLKLIFYKNNTKPPIATQMLHKPTPIFQANTHKIWGRIVQILCDNRRLCVIHIKMGFRLLAVGEGLVLYFIIITHYKFHKFQVWTIKFSQQNYWKHRCKQTPSSQFIIKFNFVRQIKWWIHMAS